jgi:hypothetical protein
VVLGSLKNPVLRALFSSKLNFNGFCFKNGTGTRVDLVRLFPEAKPEQFNYASATMQNWFQELRFDASRDNITLFTTEPLNECITKMQSRLEELDEKSHQLRSKDSVIIERCALNGFSSYDLFQEFILPECVKYNVPVTITDTTIKVG